MRIIALDVGTGTQDILLYDTETVLENNVKMVLPSQTAIIAGKIKAVTEGGHKLFLSGETMGGGPSGAAVRAHIQRGYATAATPLAAKTLNDDLAKVKSWGVEITDTRPSDAYVQVELKDVDVPALRLALQEFNVSLPKTCAVACQDHGESYGSNRVFRIQHFKEIIERGGELQDFAYFDGKIPSYLTRLKAVHRTSMKNGMKSVLVMDTGPAAIFGALCDDAVNEHVLDPIVVVNVGNGHTLAAMVHQTRVIGMFEHHTSMLNAEKLDYFLSLFMEGKLSQERVFNDGGHGCYISSSGYREIDRAYKELGFFVTTIGPRRYMMKNSRFHPYFAVPGGDMMLAGCFGLLKSYFKPALGTNDRA
ncbi:MAG: DUF1786 domain-containing protein [Halobacteriota archaeon]